LKVHSYWLFTLTREIAAFLFFCFSNLFQYEKYFYPNRTGALDVFEKTIKKVYIYIRIEQVTFIENRLTCP